MAAVNRLTRFNYFKWEPKFAHIKPYLLLMDKPAGHVDFPETNFNVEAGPDEVVADMRGREAEFSLDRHGFAVRKSSWPLGVQLPLVGDDAEDLVQGRYLPAMQRVLVNEFGDGIETLFFDWRVNHCLARVEYVRSWYLMVTDDEISGQLRSNSPVQTELDIGMTVDLTDATLRLTPLKLVHVGKMSSSWRHFPMLALRLLHVRPDSAGGHQQGPAPHGR